MLIVAVLIGCMIVAGRYLSPKIATSSQPRRLLQLIQLLQVRLRRQRFRVRFRRQRFRVRLSRQAQLRRGRSGIPSTGIGMTRPVLRQLRELLSSQVRRSQRFSRGPNRRARFPQAKSGRPSTATGTTHRNNP